MSAAVSLTRARRPRACVARGWFVTSGYAPDGDTLRFAPDDPSDLGELAFVERLALGKDGTVPVRFEGIDAPELHFLGQEQPRGWRALEVMLRAAGISEARDAVEGTIVARRCDPHGRVIGYVFRRGVAADDVRASVNAALLEAGAVYPLAYRSQPAGERHVFRALAQRARAKGLGVWPLDRSAQGVALRSVRSFGPYGALVYPKLFRRCATYLLEERGEGFVEWLAASASTDDEVVVDGSAKVRRLSQVVVEERGAVRMTRDVMGMTFAER